MKIASIIGARPQFIKIAPLVRAINSYNNSGKLKVEHFIIHTGQHYDNGMSAIFFKELDIPNPDYNLSIGSGSHGYQTGNMLIEIERLLINLRPDIVLILGDTNSTLAGALAAAKLKIPIAHIEAGLRSYNRSMPEEINRIVADHTSDLLLAPTKNALINLEKEGLGSKSVFTGDIMLDAVKMNIEIAEKKSTIMKDLSISHKRYCLATLHRAENTENIETMKSLLDTLDIISNKYYPIIFPIHPRTKKYINDNIPEWKPSEELHIISPVGYLDMLMLTKNAAILLTDSGGLQKEAFFLNTPCITLRSETEWIETVTAGANILTSLSKEKILPGLDDWFKKNIDKINYEAEVKKYFGTGESSNIILKTVVEQINKNLFYESYLKN